MGKPFQIYWKTLTRKQAKALRLTNLQGLVDNGRRLLSWPDL